MKMYCEKEIKMVAAAIDNPRYEENLEATRQLMEVIEKCSRHPITTWKEYADVYNWKCYTYPTWDELVKSEAEQSEPMSEDECRSELENTIFQLPCGWFVQFV
jgi:hypothetical protein